MKKEQQQASEDNAAALHDDDHILKINFDEKNSLFLSFSTIFFPLLEPMVSLILPLLLILLTCPLPF
jgi:hypothetical protein